jgi:hypothetical protein
MVTQVMDLARQYQHPLQCMSKARACPDPLEGDAVIETSVSVALAVDLLLTCSAGCLPFLSRVLPIGGGHLAQLGFLVGLAISFTHLWQVFGPAFGT